MSTRRAVALIGLAHLATFAACCGATYLVGTHLWNRRTPR